MHALMSVDQSYLSTAERIINEDYGSTQAYLQQALGLTTQDIEHLKAVYLD